MPNTSELAEPLSPLKSMQGYGDEARDALGSKNIGDNGFTRFLDDWVNPMTGMADVVETIETVSAGKKMENIIEQRANEQKEK